MIDGNIQRAEGEEGRRYTLSFSSEDPDTRFYMPEVLDHGPGAVDLARLNDMGVVLFNHDSNRVVGKVLSAAVEDNRGIAEIEFDADDFSQTIADKVDSGTLKGVSVRARASSVEEVKAGGISADGRFAGPCLVYRKWTPLEISIASIPADPTVGVGRSDDYQQEEDFYTMDENNTQTTTPAAEPQKSAVPPATVPPESTLPGSSHTMQSAAQPVDEESIRQEERQRSSEINTICKDFGLPDMAKDFIEKGATIADVNAAVLAHLRENKGPIGVHVQRDEGDKFRDAAVDSLLLRGGVPLQTPADGANNFRHMHLRELMIYCARQDGVASPEFMDTDDLIYRQFFTPSAAFPSILDNAVNKSYVAGYNTVAPTFERWTVKGSLADFKPTKSYRFGSAGELILVPEGGEIKHDKLQDFARPDRQLKTYGRQMTLTREAIYNDDYGIVSRIPMQYATASRRTRNRQVYAILSANPIIYDGVTLFSAAHVNLVAPGTAPSKAAVQQMIRKMSLMTDEEGNIIYAVPKYLLVPVGMELEFENILSQVTINIEGGSVQSASNSLASRNLEVIGEPTLNIGPNGEIEWFLAADETSVPSIQIDYLNGNEIPTVRRMEYPGQPGFIWDVLHDWGITVLDYRGLIKNEGALPTP